MKIAVLADTHISDITNSAKRARPAKGLPKAAYKILTDADAIIHAGDVVGEEFLQALRAIAPVYAVLGNNDLTLALPQHLELEFERLAIAVIHDSGSSKGRAMRMRKKFPLADIVVFGHSHIPMNVVEKDLSPPIDVPPKALRLFNPGSPTDRRRQPKHTMGLLTLTSGKAQAEIIHLD
jgi:uncharacterized protein